MEYTQEVIGNRVYLVVGDQYYTGCTRCGGTGHYSFDGRSTICYGCGNVPQGRLGTRVGTREDAERRSEALNRAQARRDERRNAKAQAALQALAEAQAALPEDVREFLSGIDRDLERSTFLHSMADRFNSQDLVKWGFSAKQIQAVRKVISDRANDATAKAELGPVEEGRRVIEGVVQSVKHYENQYGLTTKMLVITTTGHKVFGTVPGSLLDGRASDDLIGQGVVFTATVEHSRDDETFGIFKRPSKATLAA
ncbi:hypothetical protein SEA_THERESITA_50 [Microbacterium phage Theresita]|nr:hypothetical protein SEA_THERESITA_50 [Microbacterium phage Theresita]